MKPGNVLLRLKTGEILMEVPLRFIIMLQVYDGTFPIFKRSDCQLFVDGEEIELIGETDENV